MATDLVAGALKFGIKLLLKSKVNPPLHLFTNLRTTCREVLRPESFMAKQ